MNFAVLEGDFAKIPRGRAMRRAAPLRLRRASLAEAPQAEAPQASCGSRREA